MEVTPVNINPSLTNKFCIYVHIANDEVFYVGKGLEKRSKEKSNRSKWWVNIVNKYDYDILLIEENLTEDQAFELEKYYIKKFGRRDQGTGTLVNMTDGGEGSCGIKMSQETKDKMSLARKGVKHKPTSDETKKKISQSKKGCKGSFTGKKHSEETRIKISKNRIGKCVGDSNGFYGKEHSEETKIKMRIAKQNNKNGSNTN